MVDEINSPALWNFAEKGNLPMCAQLLTRGHPVDLRDPDTGHTPLMFAAFHGHLEVTKLLLDHGADPNKFCGENKFSPLLNAQFRGIMCH